VYTSLLEKNGFENVGIIKWWKLFDRVLAVKSGKSNPVEGHKLQDVLQCLSCKQAQWEWAPSIMKCGNCGNELPITENGVILG